MALLGLFSRKDKNKASASSVAKSVSTNGSVADSVSIAGTSESYVLPDTSTPTSANGLYSNPQAAGSTSKFNLGFHRKKAEDKNLLHPPTLPYSPSFPSTRSEADVDEIKLPPSKTQLFSAYGDPINAHSTRSLPDERRHRRSGSKELPNLGSDVPPVPKKSGGLFAWAHRERKKSKASEVPPELSVDLGNESFNLKSFRHIRPESPSADATLDDSQLLPPARPRPRENSTTSDTSQRISVAAFREMAAKRNTAGSPSMLLRPPSRTSSLENPAMSTSPSSSFQRPRPKNSPATRGSSLAFSGPDTSSESEDQDESDSDEEGSDTMRPRRQRTITQRSASGAGKATSELGHRMRSSPQMSQTRSPQSVTGHSDSGNSPSQLPKVGNSSNALPRPRASVSTSALQPNAAAKRASLLAASATSSQLSERSRVKSRVMDSDTDDSSNSDSEDSDDAPLASFMRPPRPGSAASSNASSSRPRMPSKPLIDISQMNTPALPSLISSPIDLSPPMVPEKDRGPSPAPALPSGGPSPASGRSRPTHPDKPSVSDRLARIAQSATAKSVENLADAAPFERRLGEVRRQTPVQDVQEKVSERGRVPQPTRSQTMPLEPPEPTSPVSTTSPAPAGPATRTKPNGRSLSSPNAAAAYDLTDPTPIVPTLIRERSPPPAFSVTSRPSSQLSLNSNPRLSQATVRMVASSSSTSSSPTSPTAPYSTPPTPTSPKMSTSPASTVPRPPFASVAPSTSSSSSGASSHKLVPGGRQRSSTMIANTGKNNDGFTGGGLLSSTAANAPPEAKRATGKSTMSYARPRASTVTPKMNASLLPTPILESDSSSGSGGSLSVNTSSSQSTAPTPHRFPQRPRVPFGAPNTSPSPISGIPPPKPFAMEHVRGNSPASSTGGSSSSRTPLTPADGSDYSESQIGVGIPSAMAGARKGHKRISSVQFEDEVEDKERGRVGKSSDEKRRERRRSEAKAAIELGNVVNGRINLKDDDDDDVALSSMGPRLSMAPMMNFAPASPMAQGWQGNPAAGMMGPQQFMMQPNADPRFIAAHQHAMMIAKQAYQMAVAQQAMAAAEEEWERGSSVSAFGSMGLSAMSTMGGGMSMGGMGGMGGMGMGPMNPMMTGGFGMNWGAGSMMFPNSAQSMYAGSVAGSEIGGPAWGTRSEYGGPTSNRNNRTSVMFANRPPMPNGMGTGQRPESQLMLSGEASASQLRPGPRPRTKTAPSSKAPPSSWKSSQQKGA